MEAVKLVMAQVEADTTGQKRTEPTPQQWKAIELVLAGKSDGAVAAEVGVRRQTVNEWRNHDVVFQAALNRRRKEISEAALEELRGALLAAARVVRAHLESDSADPKFALALLRETGLLARLQAIGSTDPDQLRSIERLRALTRL